MPGRQRQLAAADGVAAVGALNLVQSTATDGQGEIVDIVLFGYDLPTDVIPPPPADGGAVVDKALADRNDVAVGDTLLLGATAEPVVVAGIVSDLSQGSPTCLGLDRALAGDRRVRKPRRPATGGHQPGVGHRAERRGRRRRLSPGAWQPSTASRWSPLTRRSTRCRWCSSSHRPSRASSGSRLSSRCWWWRCSSP